MSDRPAPEPITRWATPGSDGACWLHATAVSVDGKGAVLLGASGAGKSSLALEMMAQGAALISDDGVWLRTGREGITLDRPPRSHDLIEARGIGLLHAGTIIPSAPLCLAVDLDRPEPDRLPPRRLVAIGGRTCPLIRGAGRPTLSAALMALLRHGRAEP